MTSRRRCAGLAARDRDVLTQMKLGLAVGGLILFGWGARSNNELLRWLGIGFLAAAVILRFVRPRRKA